MTTLSTRIDGHAIRPAFTHLLPHPTPLPVSKGGESTTLPVYVHRPRAHHDSADIIGGVQAPQTLRPARRGESPQKPAEERRLVAASLSGRRRFRVSNLAEPSSSGTPAGATCCPCRLRPRSMLIEASTRAEDACTV